MILSIRTSPILGSSESAWYELKINTLQYNLPGTFDPARAYDSASCELLLNVYEPLIFFDGERYDYFIPKLASQVWIAPPDPNAPLYTNFTVYFKIREGVKFHTWCRSDLGPLTWAEYTLTTEDVEHSFERCMVIDYMGGPSWMIFEPLLSCYHADPTWPSNETNPINLAVQRNATHVWLNIANKDRKPGVSTPVWAPVTLFEEDPASPWYGRQRPQFWSDVATLPLGYPLRIFFQIMSQSWAGIMSKQWLVSYAGPKAQQVDPTHPGEWDGDWTKWLKYLNKLARQKPSVDIIPGGVTDPGVTCGTGPYILDKFKKFYHWSAVKNENYWGGWPARNPHPPYPDSPIPPSCIKPIGYVERITVTGVPIGTGINNLINGDADFAFIPRYCYKLLHVGGDIYGPTLPGIRLNYIIPSMLIENFHFNLDIEPTPDHRYGKIFDYDVLNETGIPRNFFNNTFVRKALAYLVNYTMIINDLLLGEAYQPNTVALLGLPYVDPNVPKYYYDEDKAIYYFDQAYYNGNKLTDYGFTVYIIYDNYNGIRKAIAEQLAIAINTIANKMGWPFYAYTKGVDWPDYLAHMRHLPAFIMGYWADYADVHCTFYHCMHSKGSLAHEQRYFNPVIDALIETASHMTDSPEREALYIKAQWLFYEDSPTIPLFSPLERGYMRDWVHGYYYNPLFQGIYRYDLLPFVFAYNIWKWPMTDTPGTKGYLKGDVNYDGRVDDVDITAIANSNGSYATPQGSLKFHPKWNFYCDIDDSPKYRWRDRKIDMGDIVNAMANFGKKSIPWQPPNLKGPYHTWDSIKYWIIEIKKRPIRVVEKI